MKYSTILTCFLSLCGAACEPGMALDIPAAIVAAIRQELDRRGVRLDRDIAAGDLRIQSEAPLAATFRVRGVRFDAVRGVTEFLVGRESEPRRHPIIVVVRRSREIAQWIARRDISPGEKIGAADLTSETLLSADLSLTPLRMEEIAGRSTARRIRAGTSIERNMLTIPPVVHAGGAVRLTNRNARLKTVVPVVALDNGKTGERVRYRDPFTRLVGRATVAGPGELEFATE